MAGQIVDATLAAAPRQRDSDSEKAAIKAGRIPKGWKDKPAKLCQKDRDARSTMKFSKAKKDEADDVQQRDIAVPHFGYKNRISIDRLYGIIQRHKVTDVAGYDGARPREGLIDPSNTASYAWADTAYRSLDNEGYLQRHGKVSRINRKKPKGKPMPAAVAWANAQKSRVRSKIEHVFAHQTLRIRLFVRTIGIALAIVTIALVNMVYNTQRLDWPNAREAAG